MSDEIRKTWLASLAPGSKVALDVTGHGRTGGPVYVVRTVARVTPKQIHLAIPGNDQGAVRIDRETGDEMGGSRWDFRGDIQPITDTIRAQLKRRHVLSRIGKVEWDSLPTEMLEKILALASVSP